MSGEVVLVLHVSIRNLEAAVLLGRRPRTPATGVRNKDLGTLHS